MKIRINEDSWDDIVTPEIKKRYMWPLYEDSAYDIVDIIGKYQNTNRFKDEIKGFDIQEIDYMGYPAIQLEIECSNEVYVYIKIDLEKEGLFMDLDEEDFNEGYNSKHDTRQDSYGKRFQHNIKETLDDEWWEEEKKSEYADQERFEKTEELKENVGVWCWITFVTDGHNLYGITNFKDHVKGYDYDRDEYEGVIEYRIGNPDFGYDNDTDYVDGLMDETEDILRPYIKKLYGDVKSGKYEGYWEIAFTYFIFGDWEGYEPATYDYPGDPGYLEWKPGEGEVKVEKKEISERDFQDTISDWDLNPIKM